MCQLLHCNVNTQIFTSKKLIYLSPSQHFLIRLHSLYWQRHLSWRHWKRRASVPNYLSEHLQWSDFTAMLFLSFLKSWNVVCLTWAHQMIWVNDCPGSLERDFSSSHSFWWLNFKLLLGFTQEGAGWNQISYRTCGKWCCCQKEKYCTTW